MSAQAAQQPSPQKTPKVLRIGLIREGQQGIAQEKLFRIGEAVSVGENAKCSFVVPGTKLGQRHELFVARPDGNYMLNAPDWVEGKISWKDGIRGLDELRNRGEAVKKGELYQIQLNENVRGKVSVGNVTLLFQFVPAPPEPVRQVTAADFRPRMFDDEDPLFMGLLAVFSLIASGFMAWVWTTPLPEVNELAMVEDALDLVVEEKIEQVVIQEKIEQGPTEKPEEKKEAPKEEAKQEQTSTEKPEPTKESVAKKSLLLQVIGTAGSTDGANAVDDMLGDEGASMAGLDKALAGVSGVEQANAGNVGVKQGSGAGREDAKVGVGVATGGSASTGQGAEVKVKKPKIEMGDADAEVESGDKGSIASVVRKSSGRIQTCTEQALKANPDLNGRVSVGWSVVSGKVTEAHLVSNTTGNADLGKCIVNAVRSFRFDPELTAEVSEFPWVVSGQ
ncbi:MAG: AgmX/PglI C-terminal domain-containing protein [Myxococcota bacterium]